VSTPNKIIVELKPKGANAARNLARGKAQLKKCLADRAEQGLLGIVIQYLS